MRRTSEQIEADENLTEAIERVMNAYDVLSPGEITLEYAVVTATQKMGKDDDVDSSYIILTRDGKCAGSRICGLLDMASFDIKAAGRIRGE